MSACPPASSEETTTAAVPPESVAVPTAEPSLIRVTVPVGTPVPPSGTTETTKRRVSP